MNPPFKLIVYYSDRQDPVILDEEFSAIEDAEKHFESLMLKSITYNYKDGSLLDTNYEIIDAEGHKIARTFIP